MKAPVPLVCCTIVQTFPKSFSEQDFFITAVELPLPDIVRFALLFRYKGFVSVAGDARENGQ